MNIQKCLLLSAVFGAASALSAQTYLNDNFSSGTTGYIGRSGATDQGTPGVQAPGTSAFWFGNGSTYSSTNTAPVQGTAPIIYNAGTGITLVQGSTTQSTMAFFENPGNYATLAAGQTMNMSIDFTLGATATATSNTGIRMMLFNSDSTGSTNNQITANTGNTSSLFPNYAGYMVGFQAGPQASGAPATMYNRSLGSGTGIISNTPTESLANPGVGLPGSVGLVGGNLYNANLSLALNSAGTAVTLTFDLTDLTSPSTDLSAYDYSITDSGTVSGHPLITSFDGVVLGELGATADPITFDSVNISSPVAIPEPSTYAAILGAATLGMVAFRSRRQRRLSVS